MVIQRFTALHFLWFSLITFEENGYVFIILQIISLNFNFFIG